MAKQQTQKWSYSRWSVYDKCPAQYEWFYVLKQPRESSPALERGLDIHKKAENFVNGVIKGMPNELKNFAGEFKNLKNEYKAGRGFTEPDISLTRSLEAADRNSTDWFIGFADYAHFGKDGNLTVIDYKTGRKYPGHQDQGHAYSMSLLCLNPQIEEIDVEFWYLDSGEIKTFNHKQENRERMVKLWDKRIQKMYADKVYEATPNKFCKWCARHVSKGGDCDG